MRSLVLFFFFILFAAGINAQTDTSFRKPNSNEEKLYKLIMEYRQKKKLGSIAWSRSLCKVAQIHVRDLNSNNPKGRCNLHSWSDNGPWTSCCYTDDHRKASCIWDKPRELTPYSGDGFEIAYWCSNAEFSPEAALDAWKKSSGHNPLLINTGIWKDNSWKAIGIAMEGNYAVVWFGEETDYASMEN